MNEKPLDDRNRLRHYVEKLRFKYDSDDSYTFNLPEFINLMKGEKIAFAETLFQEADQSGTGTLTKLEVEEVLKNAGFPFKGTWDEFLSKYDQNQDGLIDYREFSAVLREFFQQGTRQKKAEREKYKALKSFTGDLFNRQMPPEGESTGPSLFTTDLVHQPSHSEDQPTNHDLPEKDELVFTMAYSDTPNHSLLYSDIHPRPV